MTTTALQTLTSTAWTEVASGSASVVVQSADAGEIIVNVGLSDPGAGVTDGVRLRGQSDPIVLNNLSAGDKVFVRSVASTGRAVVIKA